MAAYTSTASKASQARPIPKPPSHPPPQALRQAELTCLHDDPPDGYGHWVDWNDEHSLAEEAVLAAEFKIPWNKQGPVGPENGGPDWWRGIPWDAENWCWAFTCRTQLPADYLSITDWYSEEGLQWEAACAVENRISC